MSATRQRREYRPACNYCTYAVHTTATHETSKPGPTSPCEKSPENRQHYVLLRCCTAILPPGPIGLPPLAPSAPVRRLLSTASPPTTLVRPVPGPSIASVYPPSTTCLFFHLVSTAFAHTPRIAHIAHIAQNYTRPPIRSRLTYVRLLQTPIPPTAPQAAAHLRGPIHPVCRHFNRLTRDIRRTRYIHTVLVPSRDTFSQPSTQDTCNP